MKYTISMSAKAHLDLAEIKKYYKTNNISKNIVKNFVETITSRIYNLAYHPYSAPEGDIKGIRELNLIKYPYRIVYEISEPQHHIKIIRILYTSRKRFLH